MNKLKEMVIKSIEDSFKYEDVFKKDNKIIKEYLISNVDEYCDEIINFILRNGNIDIKSKVGYDINRLSAVNSFKIVHDPISQEDEIDLSHWFSWGDVKKLKEKKDAGN